MQTVGLISEHASPLAVAGSIDAGGQNVYVAHVARHLAQLGFAVDVFTRRESDGQPAVVEWLPGVRVVHVPAGPAAVLPKEALLPYMGEFGEFLVGYCRQRACSGRPYDLLHANFFMSGVAGMAAKTELGIPLVVTFHALGKVRRRHQGSADGFPDERFEIEEALVRDADRVIAECPQDRADLIDLYGAESERIEIVPCGFDGSEFYPVDRMTARAALGWDAGAYSILQLGRIVPRKGVDNVIRSVAALRDLHGAAVRLYIVGGNSDEPNPIATPEIARLQRVAADCGVEGQVAFVGRRAREQLRLFYGASDVFVTTPWYEPFGITPVEAMACAVPVIGARVGGIQSTVADGHTGYLVPPNDPLALACRLRHLMGNPARAHALGANGRQRAHSLYTWAGVAQSLAAVYRRVTRHRKVFALARTATAEVARHTGRYTRTASFAQVSGGDARLGTRSSR